MANKITAYTESQLHQFGKMCFEDAEGKTIKLPKSPSPMFIPPEIFAISKVEFEKAVPFAGRTGRQPDILLTDQHGRKLIVEIAYSNNKGESYIHDMTTVGMSLALELDVGKWKKNPALMPDFTKGLPLQRVVNQTTWLSCGRPSEMEWRPYAIVLYECESENCSACRMLRGGFFSYCRPIFTRLFYSTPGASLSVIARELNLELNQARNLVLNRLSSFSIDCKQVSVLTLTPDGKYIDSVEDRFPEKTFRETGWVLVREGKELPSFRVRKTPEGFQPVVYGKGFSIGEDNVGQVSDFQQQMKDNHFPVRQAWKDAVRDLFKHLAPMATPLDYLPKDDWQPATSPWIT